MRRIAFGFAVALLGPLFVIAGWQMQARAQERPGAAALRTWTSTSGHTTRAAFDSFDGEKVRLKKEDGSFVRLEIDKLSDADRDFVKSRTGGGRTAENSSSTKPGEAGETSELMVKCQLLCEEITKSYKGKDASGKATIAVVEFSDLSGGVTDFGRLLSEELITKLFATGKYKVIERLLLNKAIAEHKLQLQGLVDPKSAKELGKILGVDAIVSGTIADLGSSLRVNARVISTETGEVLSVAAATIAKDDTIKELTISIGKPARPGSNGASSPQHTKAQPVLDEKARKSRLEAAKANMESLAASATEAAQHAVSAAVQFGRNSYTAKNARQHADEVKEMADEARQEYEKMAKNANPE